MCKLGSPPLAESDPCSFWVSWNTIEVVPETDPESIEDLALISTMSGCHPKLPKLLRLEEGGDAPVSNLFLDESHQFPVVWNSSAMASNRSNLLTAICFNCGVAITFFRYFNLLGFLLFGICKLLWFHKMIESGSLHPSIYIYLYLVKLNGLGEKWIWKTSSRSVVDISGVD